MSEKENTGQPGSGEGLKRGRALNTLGRGASAAVVLAFLGLVFLGGIRPDLQHLGTVHVLDWVGLVFYVSVPVCWISAMVHWAVRYPRDGRRTIWGVIVFLGFVPGAVAYWTLGARHTGA